MYQPKKKFQQNLIASPQKIQNCFERNPPLKRQQQKKTWKERKLCEAFKIHRKLPGELQQLHRSLQLASVAQRHTAYCDVIEALRDLLCCDDDFLSIQSSIKTFDEFSLICFCFDLLLLSSFEVCEIAFPDKELDWCCLLCVCLGKIRKHYHCISQGFHQAN